MVTIRDTKMGGATFVTPKILLFKTRNRKLYLNYIIYACMNRYDFDYSVKYITAHISHFFTLY